MSNVQKAWSAFQQPAKTYCLSLGFSESYISFVIFTNYLIQEKSLTNTTLETVAVLHTISVWLDGFAELVFFISNFENYFEKDISKNMRLLQSKILLIHIDSYL